VSNTIYAKWTTLKPKIMIRNPIETFES